MNQHREPFLAEPQRSRRNVFSLRAPRLCEILVRHVVDIVPHLKSRHAARNAREIILSSRAWRLGVSYCWRRMSQHGKPLSRRAAELAEKCFVSASFAPLRDSGSARHRHRAAPEITPSRQERRGNNAFFACFAPSREVMPTPDQPARHPPDQDDQGSPGCQMPDFSPVPASVAVAAGWDCCIWFCASTSSTTLAANSCN